MSYRNERGFTLVEVIVVAAIIAVLAGILVPMIFKEVDESKVSKAQADTKAVMTSLLSFRKDTGRWPVLNGGNGCLAEITLLNGNGAAPATYHASWNTAILGTLDAQLSSNNACYGANWKGPYIPTVGVDPWGHAYVINADSFGVAGAPVLILSAGPDGIIDTATNASAPANDDIGVRIN